MNTAIRERWVAALRSGAYKQGQLGLLSATGQRYCCLGVLCDLAVEDGIIEDSAIFSGNDEYRFFDGTSDVLPESVQRWAGMDSVNGSLPSPVYYKRLGGHGRADNLAELNDEAGYTFAEIADVIEEQL